MTVLANDALRLWARRTGGNIAVRFQNLGERDRSRFTGAEEFLLKEVGRSPLLRTLADDATAGFREQMGAARV